MLLHYQGLPFRLKCISMEHIIDLQKYNCHKYAVCPHGRLDISSPPSNSYKSDSTMCNKMFKILQMNSDYF